LAKAATLAKLRAIKIAQITAGAAEAKTLRPAFGIRGRENYPPGISLHFVKLRAAQAAETAICAWSE